MTDSIRNIIQSHQEREIVKTAPDLVTYIDGLPYVINPWLDPEQGGASININDYVTSISISYGLGSLIPSAQINLSVPNHFRYQFQVPGGNRIFNTMDEIQIYSKGYFPSKTGNTIYHRVFYGVLQNILYQETGTTLEITLGCAGILRLVELTLINIAPSVMNMGGTQATAYMDNMASSMPLQRINNMFSQALAFDVFNRTSIQEQKVQQDEKNPGSPQSNAIQLGYINKWTEKLNNLRKLIYIFGLEFKTPAENSDLKVDVVANASSDPKKAQLNKTNSTKSESTSAADIQVEKISQYLPGMAVGQISLLNSKIVSRLEQIRTEINSILYEGYQDIDGKIIVKPPLYNLDVTQLDNAYDQGTSIFVENNPFVIYPSEIESENETEDETKIVATRLTIQGGNTQTQQVMSTTLRGAASFIDVGLMSRFGVREVAPRTVSFLGNNSQMLFAMAAAELRKANRGYRTYSCTIPLRPELKLGFPIYLPHHDMYAYPESIHLSYNVGGKATMSLSCDTLRKRPMVAEKTDVKDESGEKRSLTVYKTRPQLIYEFTSSKGSEKVNASDPKGHPSMLPGTIEVPDQLRAMPDFFKHSLGNVFEVSVPDTESMWRIQDGTKGAFNPVSPYSDPKKGLKAITVGVSDSKNPPSRILADSNYMNLCRTKQPYTDEKGYEVISPFPWGRWVTLTEALVEFTSKASTSTDQVSNVYRVVPGVRTFVFAGLGSLNVNTGTVDQINAALAEVQQTLSVGKDTQGDIYTAFELAYGDQSTPEDSEPSNSPAPINKVDVQTPLPSPDATTAVMVSGGTSTTNKLYSRGFLGSLKNETDFRKIVG